LNPNEEEKEKILQQKLPQEVVNIPHYMFFWGSEKDFLYRAARAFEYAAEAVFAPTSDVRSASVSSRKEQQMMDPSQVMEDIFHCKCNSLPIPSDVVNPDQIWYFRINQLSFDIYILLFVFVFIFTDWLLSRAQSFRNSGAHTSVELKTKQAQILQIDYFFVMQDDPEGKYYSRGKRETVSLLIFTQRKKERIIFSVYDSCRFRA
jgi:hypothetical protein